jgi:type I restriction enzyme S subunit
MKTRTVRLGDVATVFNGKTPSKVEQRRVGYPVLKIRDVNEFGDFTGPFTSFVEPDLIADLAGKLIRDGDTLVLNAAHNADYVASKSFFATSSVAGALATGEWLIIRPDLRETDGHFLYFWFQSVEVRGRVRDLVKGIHLYPKDVADIQLALPDLSQQRQIAGRLEQADRLRRTRRYALELTDTFLPAAFLELFGDPLAAPSAEVARLEDVLEIAPQNGLYVSVDRYVANSDPEGTEMVHMSDLFGGIVTPGTLKRALLETSEIAKYRLSERDILIARRSLAYEGAAQPCRVPALKTPLVFESSMIRITPDSSKMLAVYLYYYLSNRAVREYRVRPYVTISTISGINQDNLCRIEVVVPPLVLQQKFAALVERVECLRAVQREALRQAEHLFASLVHRVFGGCIARSADDPVQRLVS